MKFVMHRIPKHTKNFIFTIFYIIMKNEGRGNLRCYFDGFFHWLTFANIYNGYDSLGDKIINWTMYKKGPVDKPLSFASGFVSGFVSEFAVPIYLTSLDNVNWYTVLAGNIAIKTIPRGLETLIKKSLSSFHSRRKTAATDTRLEEKVCQHFPEQDAT